jgi:transposase
MELKRIAVDTSKNVFTLHGVDHQEQVVLRRDLKRDKFEAFLAKQPATMVVLEACSGSHHWGRRLTALGHQVRLIPPQYVKPFVKRGKNDRNDAEAISEAASRPSMGFVPIRTADEQARAMVLRLREMLVRQRTQLVNAMRGHATEFGVVVGKGIEKTEPLLALVAADPAIPPAARRVIATLGEEAARLDARLEEIDRELKQLHNDTPVSKRLAAIPGVGPVSAITLALTVDPARFASGRHFAAWLGLTPKEKSSGGKQRLGRISREGNERLRQRLVLGAMAVVRVAVTKADSAIVSAWLRKLLERKPRKVAAVALANKMARIVWAMMARGEAYRDAAPRPA